MLNGVRNPGGLSCLRYPPGSFCFRGVCCVFLLDHAALTAKVNIDRFPGSEKVHEEPKTKKEKRQSLNKHETVVFRKVGPALHCVPLSHSRFFTDGSRLRVCACEASDIRI
jgi:hypothetical protein